VAVLEAALRGDWSNLLVGEGLYVAPDNGFNRWFLEQLALRRRTGGPLGRLPVSGPRRSAAEMTGPVGAELALRLSLPAHLEAVGAATFLGALPGWPEAALVAELDRVALSTSDLAVAERCWRVGAGLRGAVLALRRRLFHAALSGRDEHGGPRDVAGPLRQLTARRRMADSAGLVETVSEAVEARRPLWEREAALFRPPISFGTWMARVGDALRAVPPDDRHDRHAAPPGRVLHREMAHRHRRRILDAARTFETGGHPEAAVLEALEARAADWQAAAESDAAALVGSLLRATG
jgi:hypothetical protein